MMSDSKTNRPMSEQERIDLLKKLMLERFGDPYNFDTHIIQHPRNSDSSK
jgi:hypothetical protein